MSSHTTLPLPPLLHTYVARRPSLADLGHLPDLGPRFAAILGASARFLYGDFLDHSKETDFRAALTRFHDACVTPPLHSETLRRRAGVVRYALGYLLRGRDTLAQKANNVLAVNGPYRVAGLGPVFWSALLQGLNPQANPGWTPATLAGLRRLGLADWAPGDGPAAVYASLQRAYQRIQALDAGLTAVHVDHFLTLVATMPGRSLWQTCGGDLVAKALQQERGRLPLRERLKQRGATLAQAQESFEAALRTGDGKRLGDALAVADLDGAARSPLDWGVHAAALTRWAARLWQCDEPYAALAEFWQTDALPGAGLWLPAAVLHLRDPQQFQPWNEDVRRGYAQLNEGASDGSDAAERYRLFNEGVAWLRPRYHLHPLETAAVLAALGRTEEATTAPAFGGFCADTFQFLAELARNNRRDWMERERGRYRFAVREPLLELCRALATRYVEPVLGGVHGWRLDTAPRNGRALTSICRNAYGRGDPYNTVLWIAFCARGEGGRDGAQFFVRLDAAGLRYGLRLGRAKRAAVRRFRRHVDEHAETLFELLRDNGALTACRFASADTPETSSEITSAADLRTWAANRSLEVAHSVPAGSPLLESEELVGDILLSFDRLTPLYACAADDELPPFDWRGGADRCTEADFRRATHLGGDWLRRARSLLDLKRQLILQGVPGTGKTHVARHLARFLTDGRPDAVRLVQFHPAYSYEEFVEGIRVRSVAVDGRHDVTYPVEDGLLCTFAAEAARQPALPFVLVIDELNRGNLPRVFGELLYLLEYREQAIELPYSRRRFRLPANLTVLATMNAADRSVALLDHALRRRFSFLDMPPDARILSSWLEAQAPPLEPVFAKRVLSLFETLNERLRTDLGAQPQVGHSYFMVPGLDEARLRVVWQHHVKPLLDEHFAAHPGRAAGYDLDRLIDSDPRRTSRRKQTEVTYTASSTPIGGVSHG